jgi:hypothetical protein
MLIRNTGKEKLPLGTAGLRNRLPLVPPLQITDMFCKTRQGWLRNLQEIDIQMLSRAHRSRHHGAHRRDQEEGEVVRNRSSGGIFARPQHSVAHHQKRRPGSRVLPPPSRHPHTVVLLMTV